MRDLELRGAGNLLGTQQSGHIAAVGYELYCALLEKTVRELKQLPPRESVDVSIDLPVAAYFPERYLPDMRTKIDLYRRLARIAGEAELDDFRAELADRFGELPPPVEQLIELARLRIWAHRRKIEAVHLEGKYAVLTYASRAELEPAGRPQRGQAARRRRPQRVPAARRPGRRSRRGAGTAEIALAARGGRFLESRRLCVRACAAVDAVRQSLVARRRACIAATDAACRDSFDSRCSADRRRLSRCADVAHAQSPFDPPPSPDCDGPSAAGVRGLTIRPSGRRPSGPDRRRGRAGRHVRRARQHRAD